MQNFNIEQFLNCGVYQIRNILNDKSYVGSTTMSFKKRLNHHRSLLRAGKHKNKYLQYSWNKHGEDSFIFEILEVTKKSYALEREQYYLDTLHPAYNINPLASGTPSMSLETIKKRVKTFTETINISMEYYYNIKNGNMSLDSVPDKYKKLVESRLNATPWNKGLIGADYSHLKGVPKTISEKVLATRRSNSIKNREKSPNVFVYDVEGNFLGEWRSSKDLEEWSLTDENNLPINSRFKEGKLRKPVKMLASGNIMKVFDTNKTYKGLFFKSSLTSS